ncbi:CapA family protein [Candidatus Saccharibacteria bacterium]|nr:CapA family protein [Candidatus Saccharibacteria bacterium]
MRQKKGRKKHLARNAGIGAACFLVLFVAVFFGVQFFTKTGIFRIPGVVYYDEALDDEELAFFQEIFTEEIDLDKDVTISARNELTMPELGSGEYLYNIYVPVADFYSNETNVSIASVDELFTNCIECSWKLIPVEKLDYKQKLLKINSAYYLDDFTSGAVFRIIKFESEKFDEEILPLVAEKMVREFPSADTVLTFAQTGVTALSRGMNAKLYKVGDVNYFAENIKDYLSKFDLTHTSNESSFSDWAGSRNICSDKRFIDTLVAIGLDIVELTGNHNQDCGDWSALETIDTYNAQGIKIVGGGKTADEAAIPLQIDQKENHITMLAFNQSTGGATYDDTPGANQYYEETASAQIAEAKARGDIVIVDIQYYECNAYASTYEDPICDYAGSMAGDQIGFFRHLIDLGADVVVGTSAHQPQTFELYGNGVIYYGLGNLFFDQVWWPGTTRSLILAHHMYKGKILQTEIVPTVYGDEMQTRLMDEETKQWFLKRLIDARP